MVEVVVSRFSVEKFLSQGAENFRRGTLVCCVSESFGERKSLWIRGGEESIKLFCRKLFVSQCRKFSYRNPSALRFRKFPLAKKIIDKRRGEGNNKICLLNFFVSQCRKIV